MIRWMIDSLRCRGRGREYEKVYRALDDLADAALSCMGEVEHPSASLSDVALGMRILHEATEKARTVLVESSSREKKK